jgi:murein DD-endopeptidase MepM/ murein hydrolase activator NlpD
VVRWQRAGVTALIVTVLGAAGAPAALAHDGDDPGVHKRKVDAKVRTLHQQVNASATQVASASSALATANAQLPHARAALGAARGAQAAAQAAAAAASAKVTATAMETLRVARVYDNISADLLGHRAAAGALARQAYEGGDMARLGMVLGARSPEDFTSGLAYLQAVSRSERRTLQTLDGYQRELALREANLEALKITATAAQHDAADAATRTVASTAAAAAASRAVDALVAQRTQALSDAQKLKAALEAEFAEEKAESDRLAKLIAARAAAARRALGQGHIPFSLGDGLLSFPVNGPITSPFGMRYHPILHRWKLHTGTDFGVPTGTAVHAALDGVVLQAYYNRAYGYRVIVDHGLVNGVYLVTTYNHMSRWIVHQGQHLKRGQVLGYSGATGWATGPHLHFEVLVDGKFTNPMRWLH